MDSNRETVLQLRSLLQEKFGSRQVVSPADPVSTERVKTSVSSLDTIGLQRGSLNEIVSSPGNGSGLLIGQLLAAENRSCPLALIDGRDSFDPESAPVLPRHFLWVRCRQIQEAVKAADWLLRDGNLPLVLMDLQLNDPKEARRIPSSSWYRLRALAEETDTTLLAFTPEKLLPCATTRLTLRHAFSLTVFDRRRNDLTLAPQRERNRPAMPVSTPLVQAG